MILRDIRVYQGGCDYTSKFSSPATLMPFIAQVKKVYSERMTCDVLSIDNQKLNNIPILVKCGLVDGEPYGEVDLPAIDDYVVVGFASNNQRYKVILGSFIPYLANEFMADSVNSANKTFTKKLLEKDKPLTYKRIFKNGTTIEVEEDGRIIVETPDGTHILYGGDDKILEIKDSFDNAFTMDTDGVIVVDKNGNDITMASGKVTINGNLEVANGP